MYTKTIAVIGARECDQKTEQMAEKVGCLLASSGYRIICGGLGGVMEAVCKGAKSKEGTTIGVLPGDDLSEANPFVDIALATGMGIGRNLILIRSADAVIAINGGYGTLSEIAFALQLKKPVVGVGTWDISKNIHKANSPEEAMDMLSNVLKSA